MLLVIICKGCKGLRKVYKWTNPLNKQALKLTSSPLLKSQHWHKSDPDTGPTRQTINSNRITSRIRVTNHKPEKEEYSISTQNRNIWRTRMSGDPNMEMLQESGWEELRKEARKIEGDLDVKLSSYAKLGARFTQGGTSYIVIF